MEDFNYEFRNDIEKEINDYAIKFMEEMSKDDKYVSTENKKYTDIELIKEMGRIDSIIHEISVFVMNFYNESEDKCRAKVVIYTGFDKVINSRKLLLNCPKRKHQLHINRYSLKKWKKAKENFIVNNETGESGILSGNLTNLADSHRVLLLEKLGVLDLIKTQLQIEENYRSYARLIGFILGVEPENTRHHLRYIDGMTVTKKHNPETSRAKENLKKALVEVGLDSSIIEKILN